MTTIVPRLSGTFPSRRQATLVVLGLTWMLAGGPTGLAAEGPSPEGHYAFDVPLGPVCLDGPFGLSIDTPTGAVTGEAQLTTDVRGKLSGSVELRGDTYVLTGVVKYRRSGHKIKLTARNEKDKISFKGEFNTGRFVGTAKGNVRWLSGKHDCELDVRSADAQVARITAELSPGKGSKFTGFGEVYVCGDPIPLTVKAVNGKKFKLKVKGLQFKWSAKGARFFDGVPLSWTSSGFGAKTSGIALPLDALDPPSTFAYTHSGVEYEAQEAIPTNILNSPQTSPVVFSVNPPLPTGLALDPLDGDISGTPVGLSPQTTYTVSAGNAAGVETTDVTFSVRINRAHSLVAQPVPLNDDEIRHFLSRTHMGVEQDHVNTITAGGIAAYTDQMFTWQTGTAAEAAAFPELVNDGDPDDLIGGFPSQTDVVRWWLRIMMDTEQPFQEQLAFFWHDHFAVGSEVLGGGMRHWMVKYINTLRTGGKGNFRDLLLAMSRDEAMLVYLDGQLNRRGAPNENFAREIWELFALGRDNGYTEADIVESAKAFTGYRRRYNEDTGQYFMEFDTGRHETGDKTILGQTIVGQNADDSDYEAVVNITLDNRPAAEFICKKLFAWFAYDNPPDAIVDALAATMRANNYEIEPVLRQIFASEAFYSPRARKGQVKSPLDFSIGFMRSTGLKIRTSTLDTNLTDMGQRPSRPPVVDGWPSGVSWLSAHAMVERVNHVDDVMDDVRYQDGLGQNIAAILPAVIDRTAANVVDAVSKLLVVNLTASERQDMIDYLNTVRDSSGNTVSSPFDGTSQSHLDSRVRGLLWILAQHPTFNLR